MTNNSKVSGNTTAAMGCVKESIGSAIGNRSMQADGAAQRAKGNAEVEAAKAEGYAKGTADNIGGTVKNAAGNVLGNEQMRTEGEAERLKGKTQQNVNK